ncbi:MAG: hypothetical protein ACFFAN_06900 [Promethearchaeota archaeon]
MKKEQGNKNRKPLVIFLLIAIVVSSLIWIPATLTEFPFRPLFFIFIIILIFIAVLIMGIYLRKTKIEK